MSTRHTLAAVATTAALLGLAGCGSSDAAAPPTKLTASDAADKLAVATGVTTLGDPADNTGSCASKTAGDDGCTALITTDTVSIYEFATLDVSAHWAAKMPKASDWRQVGRFGISFGARQQAYTSAERRAELKAALQKLVDADK